jgi:chemotaxis protein CheX
MVVHLMNIEYINPFIEASQLVLQQIANIEARLGKVYTKESPYEANNLMIIVGLTGKIRGQVIFRMGPAVATGIASSMMGGMEVPELDEMAKSAIGELTNMILGNTATILYNKGINIDITPPSIVMGTEVKVSTSKSKTICIPLILENSNILEINVSIEDEK